MSNIFVSSDPHFGHAGMLRFLNWEGKPCRVFDSVQDMDEFIISEHNKIVNAKDKFICLGDVAMKRSNIVTARRWNGKGRLLLGNHDIFKIADYLDAFEKVGSTRYIEPAFPGDVTLILSHYPLHPSSIKPNWINCHGHIHNNQAGTMFTPQLGPKYLNLSLEVTGYRPLAIEEIRVLARKQMTWFADREIERLNAPVV